jgi:hypothetical protein
MNCFLISAVACYILRPKSLPFWALLGAFFAGASLVKLVAIVPAVLLVMSDQVFGPSERRFARVAAAVGGAACTPFLRQQRPGSIAGRAG